MENITIDDIIAKAKDIIPLLTARRFLLPMKWRKKPCWAKNVPVSLILIIALQVAWIFS